ncbi:hypothetical protein AB5I41_22790 [Sphingomonas sp. MMS24-JH45]
MRRSANGGGNGLRITRSRRSAWAIRGEGRTGVAAEDGARDALADLILARPPAAVATAKDRRILDAVAAAAIDDLTARIAGAFPAAAPSPLWRAELRVGAAMIVVGDRGGRLPARDQGRAARRREGRGAAAARRCARLRDGRDVDPLRIARRRRRAVASRATC